MGVVPATVLAYFFACKFEFNPEFQLLPPNFPKNLTLELSNFVNWADEIVVEDIWTAYPESAAQVLMLTNWAVDHNYTIRASGAMHNWSPLTVDILKTFASDKGIFKYLFPGSNLRNNVGKTILVKTMNYLNNMEIISAGDQNASFWAQPGILLVDLLKTLERHKLGILNYPAIGEITLGGALAIGAHGTGAPAKYETLSKGHTYGSLSNLVIAFTTIVYDKDSNKYVLKEFHRSEATSGAFLVHLGKTFVTNVTMRAGPLQYVRCQSFTDISAQELFDENNGLRSIPNFLNRSGRIEVIWFPFTSNPWLKVWTVSETKPEASLYVHEAYNYPFTDRFPEALALILGKITSWWDNVKIINRLYMKFITFGLTVTGTWDIWGASPNVFFYVKPETLKMTESGWAIVTSRSDVRKALQIFYELYTSILDKYSRKNRYPMNGPLGVRITGVDNPQDVGIDQAQTCGICSSRPVLNKPELDTVIWLNILTFRTSYEFTMFVEEIQNSLNENFDGAWAVVRVEWSKGFAYSSLHSSAWTNQTHLKDIIPGSWTDWESSKDTLNQFDPFQVFSNQLLNTLFQARKDL
ncbi:unnamed protein product [Allacma fusca]|uniref:FAD-binding PCMH-type domain-containing protein n=1 Tax=Allacma fusca TaxID=39272 RepID=A0A8J2LT30_9HEXA|nr:unnamed protein product [Allacma fusca]